MPRRPLPIETLDRIQRRLIGFFGLTLMGLAIVGEASRMGSVQLASTFPPIPGGPWLVVGLLVAVLIMNGFFVAGETSVALLRPMHIRHLKEQDEKRGAILEGLLENQARASAACKLGSDLARLFSFMLVLLLAPGAAAGFGWDSTNFWYVFLAAVVVYLPVGVLTLLTEQAFRGFAIVHPHGAALRLSKFIRITAFVLAVPAGMTTNITRVVARHLGKVAAPFANQAEEEIKTLVESAEESGEIERGERELLHSVFEFGDTVAREIMTPRVDIDAMDIESSPTEIMNVIQKSGHSRIPIYEETDDHILGVIHAKDLLLAMVNNGSQPDLRALMRDALFVPENKPLSELLSEMKVARAQIAIVNDEFGGTAGVVTIEDIVEELVGDIVDEYDDEEIVIEACSQGWSVDGKMHIDDLNHEIGSHFDSDEFDTVGGFVFGSFGRQPREGDSIEIEGYRFAITQTDGRRVNRLLVCPPAE